jgi:diketogulonate reductase-like aldo/keto reductase
MSQTVTLQSSKTVIPRIGYGSGTKWFSRDDTKPIDKDLVKSIHDAFSIGYRHLDTAEMYGTDKSVGEALRTQSIPRNELFITSKVYKSIPNIEQACLDVLSRLDIDYLDLWLIHSPFFDRNKISLEQAWKEMEKLVENGKVKAIGVSNFQKKHLEELLALNPKIKPAVNQIEFNPYVYEASRELIEFCKSNGIAIEAYSPLGPISYKPGGPVDEVVEKLAQKYNRSPAQILLKWNLIKGDIVITTSGKRERLEDFLQVFDENFQLNEEDIQAIDEAGAKLHFRKYWATEIDGKK